MTYIKKSKINFAVSFIVFIFGVTKLKEYVMEKFEVLVIGTYISKTIYAENKKDCAKKAKEIFSNIPNARFKYTKLDGFFI